MSCLNSSASPVLSGSVLGLMSSVLRRKALLLTAAGTVVAASHAKLCLPLPPPDATNDFCCYSCSRYFWTQCKYIWYVSNPQHLRLWKQDLQNNQCKYDLVHSNQSLPAAWSRIGQHCRSVSPVLPHCYPQPARTCPLDWTLHCRCRCPNFP